MRTKLQFDWRRIAGFLAGIALIAAWCLGLTALAADRVHVVRSGESLWSIAEGHLGSGERWGALYRVNRSRVGDNPGLIRPGLRLVLAGGAARVSARYRVRPGDSLWSIAHRKLGAGDRWQALYARNRDRIGSDPDLIRPGTVLAVGPAKAIVAARRKAPRHVARALRPVPKPVAKAPVAKPVAKAPVPKPVARAPVPRPVAKAPVPKPVARAPVPRPVARAPVPKPVAKAPVPKPVAKPVAKAPVRNPFEYRGGPAAPKQPPAAAGTPPGRNPFAFGSGEKAPGAKTLPGQAQRRIRGMPVVPAYPEDGQAARKKGTPPVAVDVQGGRPVAKRKRGKRHLASSPHPTPKKN
jgi:LysM repeat protein